MVLLMSVIDYVGGVNDNSIVSSGVNASDGLMM